MSDYIMDLRKIVGHRPLLQVGASVIVEDEEGRVLLQKRSDNHCWGYAGGSVELDEDVEDAAKRELLEETGLTANSLELFGVFSGKELHYIYPNGDEVSNIDIVYICKDYTGTLKRQESEVEELRFFAPDEIPDKLSPPIRKPLEQWLKAAKQRSSSLPVEIS
ncbi:MAG TPA: NUDIX hydrolase [Candidatus Fusicatenibacter merdavium]|uniref:NUDIX hydrolase n=1 Tax=Candidatus Fusicatenibacter merdavium TaxID=2838600 RepID=A0A9D1XF10_9FIRM|nr:NUDIX hydrolase [Candidatus Fusicatenibacter merdavium]